MVERTLIKEKYNNPSLNIALDTISKGKQALIFTNTKRSAEKVAEDIALRSGLRSPALSKLSDDALKALPRPTRQCQRLALCIKNGTAFHHAGLTLKQREIVEDNFRKGLIKIIAATPTLAFGLDLPAYRSIIRDLRRYTSRGLQYIPVLEYLQMAGRAGRPKFDKEGEAIIIAGSEAEKDKLTERYIHGEPEEIYSKLAVEPVLRTYLLSLISANFVRSRKQIFGFFEDTFWAHQYRDMAQLESIIDRMLALLVDYEFLISSADEFASASELEDVKYRATQIGKRVAELYLDPLTAHNFIVSLQRATSRQLLPFSFLHMISYTQELRPLLRVTTKEYEEVQEESVRFESNLLVLEPTAFEPEYDEYLNSIKTAMFFNEWIEEADEESLLERFNIRPGETRMKLELADWLLYSSSELAKLMQFAPIVREIAKLRVRLKYGVREELLPLLKLRGIGRVRARALFRNSIRDIKGVKNSPVETIAQILKSRKLAESVKEQIGEKVEKASPRKRKGQKSILRF